ncbi:nucleotide exchange factor GrpE [Ectothiorhodospiraceae bacterium WFHF3C12]|nr:nucleotide exchange factor GrpE [Ectothiorhodospiraceae bacterium WFHF3C12]
MANEQDTKHQETESPEAAQQPTDGEDQPGQGQEAGESVAELRQQLEEARTKAEENWNQFLRARAELENVRRRAERDVEQAHKYAIEKLATELLSVKDSLEMGVQAANEPGADVAKLREGSELTLKMMNQLMERFSIKPMNPQGEKFDPELHEAMAAQESAEHDPNTVIHVVQKGYVLHDRLLRPAMVIVAKPGNGSGGGIDEQA